jgi:hypothetical protein
MSPFLAHRDTCRGANECRLLGEERKSFNGSPMTPSRSLGTAYFVSSAKSLIVGTLPLRIRILAASEIETPSCEASRSIAEYKAVGILVLNRRREPFTTLIVGAD